MKEILDKYKEICQVLFVEGIDDEVLIAKVHRKIDNSINMLSSIFDSEKLIIDDLYAVLDIMSSTIRHCLYMFPRTYDGDAATLTVALLKVTRDLFEDEVLESVPVKELVDKDVVIELVNGRLDAIIDLFNHDGPFDDSYLNDIGYVLGKNTIHVLYKALKEKHTIREYINIDISHRHDETHKAYETMKAINNLDFSKFLDLKVEPKNTEEPVEEDEPDIKSFYIRDMRTDEHNTYPLFVRNNGDLVINYDFMEKLLYDDNVLINIRFGLKGQSYATEMDIYMEDVLNTNTLPKREKYGVNPIRWMIELLEWVHVYVYINRKDVTNDSSDK